MWIFFFFFLVVHYLKRQNLVNPEIRLGSFLNEPLLQTLKYIEIFFTQFELNCCALTIFLNIYHAIHWTDKCLKIVCVYVRERERGERTRYLKQMKTLDSFASHQLVNLHSLRMSQWHYETSTFFKFPFAVSASETPYLILGAENKVILSNILDTTSIPDTIHIASREDVNITGKY